MAFRPLWKSLASEARGGKGLVLAIDAALKALWEALGTIPGGIGGDVTGDLIRWNEEEESWEVKFEPFDLKQINFVPAAEALEDTEGGVFYKEVEKSMYVCTEGE